MTIKKTKEAKISFGKKDQLKSDDFEAQNIRHRISIMIPEDVLMAYREHSKKENIPYQTLMNAALKRALDDDQEKVEARLKRIEKKLKLA